MSDKYFPYSSIAHSISPSCNETLIVISFLLIYSMLHKKFQSQGVMWKGLAVISKS